MIILFQKENIQTDLQKLKNMDNTLSKLENTQPTEEQAARQQNIIDQVRDGNYEP